MIKRATGGWDRTPDRLTLGIRLMSSRRSEGNSLRTSHVHEYRDAIRPPPSVSIQIKRYAFVPPAFGSAVLKKSATTWTNSLA